MKRYFIAYAWHHKQLQGFGNGTYDLKRDIDIELIRAIEKDLQEFNEVDNVVVISYQLISDHPTNTKTHDQ